MTKGKLIAIVGTTASGKSSLGIDLAKHYNGEIVSADSRQVYRHLDLGTGKVTKEEMAEVKHHLIDILDLNQPFSVAHFQKLAYEAIDDILKRGRLPFLVGGTGLYTRAVVEGYNLSDVPPDAEQRKMLESLDREELCSRLEKLGEKVSDDEPARRLIRRLEKLEKGVKSENLSQPRYDVLQLGLTFDREELYSRIGIRLDQRIKEGMIDEVREVVKLGATPEFLEGLGLEYRLTYRYITGKYKSFEEYREDLFKQIRHFAKRQMTWFRKEKDIVWLNSKGDYLKEAITLIDDFLKK